MIWQNLSRRILFMLLAFFCLCRSYAQNRTLTWDEPVTPEKISFMSAGPAKLVFQYSLDYVTVGNQPRLVYYIPHSYLLLDRSTPGDAVAKDVQPEWIQAKFNLFHLRNLRMAALYNGFYKPSSIDDRLAVLNENFARMEEKIDSLYAMHPGAAQTAALADSVRTLVYSEAEWKQPPHSFSDWIFALDLAMASNQLGGEIHNSFRSHLLFLLGASASYKNIFTRLKTGFGTSFTREPGYWPIEAFKPLKQHSVFLLNHTLGYSLFAKHRLNVNPEFGYSLLNFKLIKPEEAPPATDHTYPNRQLLGYTLGVDFTYSLIREIDYTTVSLLVRPVKKEIGMKLVAGVRYMHYSTEVAGSGVLYELGVRIYTRNINFAPQSGPVLFE